MNVRENIGSVDDSIGEQGNDRMGVEWVGPFPPDRRHGARGVSLGETSELLRGKSDQDWVWEGD